MVIIRKSHGPFVPMTNIRIQLANKVLTLKRYYVQLIDVLGDVGGLMEVIFSFFNILSSLVVSILYEESLVNNLFSFDLDKKIISLKEKHNKKNINFIHQEEPLFELKNNPNIKGGRNSAIINAESIMSNNKLKEWPILNKVQENNNEEENAQVNIAKYQGRKRKQKAGSQYIPSRVNIYGRNKMKNNNIKESEKESDSQRSSKKKENKGKDENLYEEDRCKNKFEDRKRNLDGNADIHGVVDKISLNKFLVHIFFCCIRIPKNMKNILLDEGMRIIIEQLEIFNLFIKLYKEEKMQRNIDQKAYQIEMSDEFKMHYKEMERDLIDKKNLEDNNTSYSD